MFLLDDLSEELKGLYTFTDIFERYRLIEPCTNRVYRIEDGVPIKVDTPISLKIWDDNRCINELLLNTCKDKYIKIEYLDNKIFMILAKQVKIKGKEFFIEFITDVTNKMYIVDIIEKNVKTMELLMTELNSVIKKDPFTGLYNKKFMFETVEKFISENEKSSVSLMIIDIDKFKLINDNYGHVFGDIVIKKISNMLDKINNFNNCFAGRMGGDEFAAVFKGYTIEEARKICRDVVSAVEEHQFIKGTEHFKVKLSYAVEEHLEGESFESFLDRTDISMYKHKRSKKYIV